MFIFKIIVFIFFLTILYHHSNIVFKIIVLVMALNCYSLTMLVSSFPLSVKICISMDTACSSSHICICKVVSVKLFLISVSNAWGMVDKAIQLGLACSMGCIYLFSNYSSLCQQKVNLQMIQAEITLLLR